MKHSSSCDNFCKAFFVLALTWRPLSACDGWFVTPRAGTISVPRGFLYLFGASFIMNRTLFDCGIQKKVELRSGDLYDVTETLPKAVKLKYDSVRCGICSQSFFGKQYLDQHMRFKHPSECNGRESTDQSISLQSSSSPRMMFKTLRRDEMTVCPLQTKFPEGDVGALPASHTR